MSSNLSWYFSGGFNILQHLFHHLFLLSSLMFVLVYVFNKLDHLLVVDGVLYFLVKVAELVGNKLKHFNIYWFR